MVRMTWTWLLAEVLAIKSYYWATAAAVFGLVFLLSVKKASVKVSLARGLLPAYVILIVVSTTLNRTISAETYNLIPFWSYRAYLRGRRDVISQAFLNVVMFIPFGFLGAIVSGSWFKRKSDAFKGTITVLASVILSIAIEVTQLITHKGLCETDDVIHNSLGTIIGYGCWHLYKRIKRRYFADTHEAE